MKELSIEQKAKAYDEAIEKAKEYFNSPRTCFDIEQLCNIFPELTESDDENIKKDIINHLKYLGKYCQESMPNVNEWVTWLEKQGEQNPAEWHREDEQNLNACLGYIPDEFLRRWLTDAIHVKYDKSAWSEEDEKM
jgi:hypothetical protein